jgi:hypothetical protein
MWLALFRGEVTTVEAADRAGVDRSTVVKLRQVGKQGEPDGPCPTRPTEASRVRYKSRKTDQLVE